jgi:N-acetyl-gamma-glutamyl-phosphate reductase
MTARVFIDGEAGTTGLQIRERLEGRGEFELLRLADHERKDEARRAAMLNAADVVILCLPDDAARQAVAMIDNPTVKVIDASTAHRISDGWVYGFPEYSGDQAALIAAAPRVTNPGCYALASVAMIHPLVAAGLLPADWPLTINAVSGYSGGGKGMIASFEEDAAPDPIHSAFFAYGLGLAHKHVPEIQRRGGLSRRPLLAPSVGRYRQGMIVQIPLHLQALPGAPAPEDIHAALAAHYADCRFVDVAGTADSAAVVRLDPEALNGTNSLRLYVFGNREHGQAVVVGVLDNLGKGASGQSVQNLNLMCGLDEDAGLDPAPTMS